MPQRQRLRRGRGKGMTMEVRVADPVEVLQSLKVGKGLRGAFVGGLKRKAQLTPDDGGFIIQMKGTGTFVPVASGQLGRTWNVDQAQLIALLTGMTKLGTPDVMVSIVEFPDKIEFRAGTLKASLVGK